MVNLKPRIIYNDDADCLRNMPPPHTEEKVYEPLRCFKGSQVDALCWCVAEEVAAYPSKILETWNQRWDQHAKDGDFLQGERDLMYSLYRRGVDYLPLLIGKAHEYGMKFFASYRMNDTHHKSDPESALCPEFWKSHQEYRLWEIEDARGYYNAALDYSFPEVRARKAGSILEVAGNYDVDGIEMDFSRTPYLFQPSEAWKKRGVLTRFVADVRKQLDRIGKKKGRPIGLLVRVPFDETGWMRAGIDVKAWIDRKLADILVMTRLHNDYNQSVEPWLSLCRKRKILFYPAVEVSPLLYRHYFYHSAVPNPNAPAHNYNRPPTLTERAGQIRAMAQNYLAQDVDGVYLFNYGVNWEMGQDKENAQPLIPPLFQIGNPRTLAGTQKQYLFLADPPIWVESGRPAQYHQTIRFNVSDPDLRKKGTKAVLSFRQVAEKNTHCSFEHDQDPIVPAGYMEYLLNGKKLDEKIFLRTRMPSGRIPCGFVLRDHEKIDIELPANRLTVGENTLAFHIPRFPQAQDPHVFIYELTVDVVPKKAGR